MPTVAEMIGEAMLRRNMTQQRLAKEARVTAPWINMIIRRGKVAGAGALLRIAHVLGIDVTELVRQAHYERAYDEWKPYLERVSEDPPPRASMVPVVGRMMAGGEGVEAGRAEVEGLGRANGTDETADAPGVYGGGAGSFVGFDRECRAIRVEGDALEPVAYDGQYVVVSPNIRKEDVPDGAIVYVTYEFPGHPAARAMIRRMYRYRLAGEESGGRTGLPVYNFVPVNTRLRMKGRGPEGEGEGAVTLRHRKVREMFPVVGVVFEVGGE